MRGIWSAIGIGLVVVSWSPPADSAETGWRPLTVRVYDGTGLSKAITRGAMDAAAQALRPASIEVMWVTCARSSGGRCGTPLGPGEVIVRLVRGAGAEAGASDLSLGNALVDPATGIGVLATIYVERVERMASSAGTDVGTLLGRAMAHEIGHLLLGGGPHGVSGLMRPRWTREELVRNVRADWRFAATDVQAIRARF